MAITPPGLGIASHLRPSQRYITSSLALRPQVNTHDPSTPQTPVRTPGRGSEVHFDFAGSASRFTCMPAPPVDANTVPEGASTTP